MIENSQTIQKRQKIKKRHTKKRRKPSLPRKLFRFVFYHIIHNSETGEVNENALEIQHKIGEVQIRNPPIHFTQIYIQVFFK